MKNLNSAQLKSLSEFTNTIATAWLSAGVIAPFFTKPKSLSGYLLFFIISVVVTSILLKFSLWLLKDIKK